MTAVDQLHRFQQALGIEASEPWLRPPAAEAQVRRVEQELGSPVPDDLRSVWAVHDGGRLADISEWMGCDASPGYDVIHATESYDVGSLVSVVDDPGRFDVIPGPNTLLVAVPASGLVLYDLDDRPGRLLYSNGMFTPIVVPLARSLARYFEAWAAVAEAGLVDHDETNIWIPDDELVEPACRILLDHGVAPAVITGTGSWVSRPEYHDFELG